MPPAIQGAGAPAERPERISFLTAFFMVVLAIIFDGMQDLLLFLVPIPVVGFIFEAAGSWFISFLAAAVFGIWFALLGVNYFSGKKAATKMLIVLASLVVELIPLLDALPAITFGVVALIIQTRIEDKGMSGLQIKQVLGGVGQMTGAFGIRGSNARTDALESGGDNGT